MKNKKSIKILFLLIMCICILLIYKIIDIYALFHSEMIGNVQFKNGTWNITINGEDITGGSKNEIIIDLKDTNQSNYVKPGKLAPGLTGSFEIVINPKDTNVSVRYDIMLNKEELDVSNIVIKSVEEIENGYELIQTAQNTYTGLIPLEDINNGISHKIKIEIEWIDDRLNDESDTEIGKNESYKLQIPITVHAIQYLGEEIIPTTGEEKQEQ